MRRWKAHSGASDAGREAFPLPSAVDELAAGEREERWSLSGKQCELVCERAHGPRGEGGKRLQGLHSTTLESIGEGPGERGVGDCRAYTRPPHVPCMRGAETKPSDEN